MDSILGPLTFDEGWYASGVIQLFHKDYTIGICVQAYYEQDGITQQQETALADYREHEAQRLTTAENLLYAHFGENCAARFIPQTMVFERDGSYALLCDDCDAPEEGIAVLLSPEQRVLSQDDYL